METEYKRDSQIVLDFENEVHNQSADIDPSCELHWESLTVGWALGKGLNPEEALEFTLYIRHKTSLG